MTKKDIHSMFVAIKCIEGFDKHILKQTFEQWSSIHVSIILFNKNIFNF